MSRRSNGSRWWKGRLVRAAEIVRLETDINARVYTLFDLTPAEVRLVEESTKYRYGEV